MVGHRTLWAVVGAACGVAFGCSSGFDSADPPRDAGGDAASDSGGSGASGVGGNAGSAGSGPATGGTAGTAGGGNGGNGGNGGDAGNGAGGASASGGTGGINPCSVLSDDFNVPGEPDPLLWKVIQHNGTINQQGGLLSIAPAGTGYPSKPFLRSFAQMDLRECTLEVHVTSVVATTEKQRTRFAVDWYGPSPWFAFTVEGGTLYPKSGSPQSYEPAQHQRWRIRSSGGSTHLETSGDGGAWALHGTVATPPEFETAGIWLGAECDVYPGTTAIEASFEYAHAY